VKGEKGEEEDSVEEEREEVDSVGERMRGDVL
jgi:hypothetical protein